MFGPNTGTQPTPRQAYELGVKYARLLRVLFAHPQYKYTSSERGPGGRIPVDTNATPMGLIAVTDMVQNTYVEHILPLLPPGASIKTRDLANPWNYANPAYEWEWEWDDAEGVLRSKQDGTAPEFPRFSSDEMREKVQDMFSRGFMTEKCICENGSDPMAAMMLGGQPIDFGDEARRLVSELLPKPDNA